MCPLFVEDLEIKYMKMLKSGSQQASFLQVSINLRKFSDQSGDMSVQSWAPQLTGVKLGWTNQSEFNKVFPPIRRRVSNNWPYQLMCVKLGWNNQSELNKVSPTIRRRVSTNWRVSS